MKLHLSPKPTVAQSTSFAGSILPKTINLSVTLRTIIEPKLEPATKSLPYDDRVLAWLAPELRKDIVLFHGGTGKSLDGLFPAAAIAHLDSEFSRILRRKVEEARPDVIAVMDELALQNDVESLAPE